jgi:hypothetical protein
VGELVDDFIARNSFAAMLRRRLLDEAGVRFFDMVDHISLPASADWRHRLEGAGFRQATEDSTHTKSFRTAIEVFVHPGGIFPAIHLRQDQASSSVSLALKVESVIDFFETWHAAGVLPTWYVASRPLDPVRVVVGIAETEDTELAVIERHGVRYDLDAPQLPPERAVLALKHSQEFRTRKRMYDNPADGFDNCNWLIESAIRDLGRDYACDLFFAAERAYWQRRNRAAQVQKARQDRLGIGWANHDHHTYRSSRQHFARLIAVFEKLGFHCRERFHPGGHAGWGAQVLEQPEAGIVIFADVDLSPDELMGDFSHDGLEPRHELGTVGLWCALHGEAFLEAGMHHLECQFGFDALRQQLEGEEDVKVMKPFTDFPFLRQAFTEGERWPVRPERIDRLLRAGQITPEQAENFRKNGALGSHLENLERNDGFKGFIQQGVSESIAKTDPRHQP